MTDFFGYHVGEINLDRGLIDIRARICQKEDIFLQRAGYDHDFELLPLGNDFDLRKNCCCEKQNQSDLQ